ncbi:MAG: nitrate reductase subunit beta [Bacteroidales bacterium]|nr:nitrate reductase subunit beta [Bacteroidales bacterium]
MKIKAQICMVLNLDKCIGCHTCSVSCKNVWTTRPGIEYTWFNNVETKPGKGYPTDWENQNRHKGGWTLDREKLVLLQGGKTKILSGIFANLHMPSIDDYYEPFTFNFSVLQKPVKFVTPPSARPYSILTGKLMDDVKNGPNWDDDLGGEFKTRKEDTNFNGVNTDFYEEFEKTFMYYVPRLCEHCLNAACVASCPSGAIYKRDEDGIVLIDEDKCRGWRYCVSGCPYKKSYFNWVRKRSEKCVFCYPKIQNGKPTLCAETCVGRIRYIGVILYDQEKIKEYSSVKDPAKLYQAQLNMFLNPNDPDVEKQALEQGISFEFLQAAKKSPVYKMMVEWKIAFPLHPEYRTLPMTWYVPTLSPFVYDNYKTESENIIPNVDQMRIPVKFQANMFTAGDEAPVRLAIQKLVILRNNMKNIRENKETLEPIPAEIELNKEQLAEMYQYLAIAPYEMRFVIPTRRVDLAEDPFALRAESGFPKIFGKTKPKNLFGGM